jgi:hypothetical protein
LPQLPTEYLIEKKVFDTLFTLLIERAGKSQSATSTSATRFDNDLKPVLNDSKLDWMYHQQPYTSAAQCRAVVSLIVKEAQRLTAIANRMASWTMRDTGDTLMKQGTSTRGSAAQGTLVYESWPGDARQLVLDDSFASNLVYKPISVPDGITCDREPIYTADDDIQRAYHVSSLSPEIASAMAACPCLSVCPFDVFFFSTTNSSSHSLHFRNFHSKIVVVKQSLAKCRWTKTCQS